MSSTFVSVAWFHHYLLIFSLNQIDWRFLISRIEDCNSEHIFHSFNELHIPDPEQDGSTRIYLTSWYSVGFKWRKSPQWTETFEARAHEMVCRKVLHLLTSRSIAIIGLNYLKVLNMCTSFKIDRSTFGCQKELLIERFSCQELNTRLSFCQQSFELIRPLLTCNLPLRERSDLIALKLWK